MAEGAEVARTWMQMARTALDGGRVWREVVRARRIDPRDLAFTAVDFMVLSLVLDLEKVDVAVCADEQLRALLDDVCFIQGTAPHRRFLASPDSDPYLHLTTLRTAGGRADGQVTQLAYGLGGGFALSDCSAEAWTASLRPLSCAAPALWQCGLALVVFKGEGSRAAALIDRLALSMRGEWIDPLALYERVQVMTAKLKGLGHAEEIDPEAKLDRIAELENELASLKRAALVSQHLALVDAVERARGTP